MKRIGIVAAIVAILGSVLSMSPAQAADSQTGGVVADDVRFAASGRTVDAASGRAVPFVLVIAYEEDYSTVVGVTLSDHRGRFVVRGLTDEEFALRYIGTLTWHESGWQACNRTVVPTPGEACTQGPGEQGQIKLDRL